MANETVRFTTIEEQMKLLGEFVEGQLGEKCSVCVYQDSSCMVETDAGRGFGFDSLDELINKVGEYKRD